jgi:hypothetical protein
MAIFPFTLSGLASSVLLLGVSAAVQGATPPQPTLRADPIIGSVNLYNEENQNCRLTADNEGQSAFNTACDYAPTKVLVEEMPSQSTLLLSARGCSESTEGSNWWVKLQATARRTSTNSLPVSNIVNQAERWLSNPGANSYVAPNLKLVGAQIKDGRTPKLGCALLQLSATDPTNLLYTQPRSWEPVREAQDAQCGDGVLLMTYSESKAKFSYQCADLLDHARRPFKAVNEERITVLEKDKDKSCPAGKLVTGLRMRTEFGSAEATMTCANLQTQNNTAKLVPQGSEHVNRWVGYDQHNSLCENPRYPGPTFLLSMPNGFLTGMDLASKDIQWRCTQFGPAQVQ